MNKTVAKGAIGGFVVLSFVIYSLYQRNEGSQATPSPSPTISSNSSPSTSPVSSSPTSHPNYKDGSYTGKSVDAFYGFIQVKATVSGGTLTDVEFLDYPKDQRNSIEINQEAMPILKSRALQIQSAQVDGISGATDTSEAFIKSLDDALTQARS